jgi:hypothetical protein
MELDPYQRRAEEVVVPIREAFLRGISTCQVGRVVAILTGEPVSAQTVSTLTRYLDQAVRQFHQACFVNVESLDRIIYSILQRFNLDWKNRTLKVFTQAA